MALHGLLGNEAQCDSDEQHRLLAADYELRLIDTDWDTGVYLGHSDDVAAACRPPSRWPGRR